jgi:hypothetical protein
VRPQSASKKGTIDLADTWTCAHECAVALEPAYGGMSFRTEADTVIGEGARSATRTGREAATLPPVL